MGPQRGTMFPILIGFSGEGNIQGIWHLGQLGDRGAVSPYVKGVDTHAPIYSAEEAAHC